MKPIIKFNGWTPIALCNDCGKILCYVKCLEDETWVVYRQYREYDTGPIGGKIPTHCLISTGCNKKKNL